MKTLEELMALREKARKDMGVVDGGFDRVRVVVGMATCGIAAGARPVLDAFNAAVDEKGLKDVVVSQTGCIGVCQFEPVVEVYEAGKEKVTYVRMTADKAKEVVEKHLIGGTPIYDYTLQKAMK